MMMMHRVAAISAKWSLGETKEQVLRTQWQGLIVISPRKKAL